MAISIPPTTALLLVDVINDMNFPGGERLRHHALPAAHKIAELRQRLSAKGVPVIYVNDNFGQWQSDFRQQIERCMDSSSTGHDIVRILKPRHDDYFVLKPKHSGFYSTPLDVLLSHLEITTLILAGFAADICVLYTANDAYMRDFSLIVPSDCVASEDEKLRESALEHIRHRLKAEVCPSQEIG